jgi:NAD(P)-dependent dehydrogenase (short-subunit alcohol dehydrogenase family)
VPNPKSIRGRKALVTGGGKRLGREIAIALAETGAQVAVHYNSSRAEAEEVLAELERSGSGGVTAQAALDDPGEAEALFERVWESMDGLDFVVNNASIFPEGRLDELELRDIHRNFGVNSWTPFVLTRALWRKLRGTGKTGGVVNLLDTRLVGGDLAHAGYHLSKAMLGEITAMTALEFSPELRVNAVAPGAVLPPEGLDDAYLGQLTRDLPLMRRGYPRDIADAVVYLLGATFVTGQTIYVDGGRHLRLGGNT